MPRGVARPTTLVGEDMAASLYLARRRGHRVGATASGGCEEGPPPSSCEEGPPSSDGAGRGVRAARRWGIEGSLARGACWGAVLGGRVTTSTWLVPSNAMMRGGRTPRTRGGGGGAGGHAEKGRAVPTVVPTTRSAGRTHMRKTSLGAGDGRAQPHGVALEDKRRPVAVRR